MKKYYIYVLTKEDVVFYVGVAGNLENRRAKHLKRFGRLFEMNVVDQYYGKKDTAHALEMFWIKKYRDLGYELANICGVATDDDLKRSFTYSGDLETRMAAECKAKKQGMTFSELVEKLLKAYISGEIKLNPSTELTK
jgi:hypothetical protein